MTDVSLSVGATFDSFQSVAEAVSKYEREKMANFYISDSKKLMQAAKQVPKLVAKARELLDYYYLVYTCISGGRKFASTSKGARPNQRYTPIA